MSRLRMLLPLLTFALAGCAASVPLDEAYEACNPGDACAHGTICVETTLPVSLGFQGSLCTNGCNVDQDCLQDLNNFPSICVNSQCYTECQGSQTCPGGTGCLSFQDQEGFEVDICSP